MIKVSNAISVYEVDGKEAISDGPTIEVRSHWSRQSMVVLKVNGQSLTVIATDLEAAIRNATNSGCR
jgi:hypothetical protein